MTTALTREIVRETEIEIGKRKLLVYLTPKQKLGFKLKGLRNEPFFFNLVYLMPKINKFKDDRNERAFKVSHFASVIINFAQLIMLGVVLI